ncbi:MAG: branched-chain amino acid ABC transporter substrate-binding protein, partial [Actinomycetota bacterium]
MGRERWWAAAVSLAVAVALFGAGCGGSERGGSGESVKIVSDLPLQGIDRVQAETMVNAIEMAV